MEVEIEIERSVLHKNPVHDVELDQGNEPFYRVHHPVELLRVVRYDRRDNDFFQFSLPGRS